MTSLSPPPPRAHDSRAWVFAPAVRGVLENFVYIYFLASLSLLRLVRTAEAFFAFPSFSARDICTHVAIIIVHSRLTPLYQRRPGLLASGLHFGLLEVVGQGLFLSEADPMGNAATCTSGVKNVTNKNNLLSLARRSVAGWTVRTRSFTHLLDRGLGRLSAENLE